MAKQQKVSSADYVPSPPRSLAERERAGLLQVADALIPDGPAGPRPSMCDDYEVWLERALAARRDAFERIVELAAALAEVPHERLSVELQRVSDDPASGFDELSAVVAGAYVMQPAVRRTIGYPGQALRPSRVDEAVEQIMSGVLDAVIARGRIYRATPGDGHAR